MNGISPVNIIVQHVQNNTQRHMLSLRLMFRRCQPAAATPISFAPFSFRPFSAFAIIMPAMLLLLRFDTRAVLIDMLSMSPP